VAILASGQAAAEEKISLFFRGDGIRRRIVRGELFFFGRRGPWRFRK
jgi:hypothetical protein